MSTHMVIELPRVQSSQTVVRALDIYKLRLRASIERTQRRLNSFERHYGATTVQFLDSMTAEDLEGGDLEYVDWAGEAKMLEGLESELTELESARYRLP